MEWKNCKRHWYEAVSSALISYIKCLLPTLFGASCRCNRQEMSLYTEKRNLSCSCFLHNTSPMQHSCDYYKVTTSQSHHFPCHHFPSSPLPIVTTSLPHHFPSSPLPFVTTSLSHHFLPHHFPSSPFRLVTTSLPHHFPSSPLPFVTTSLRHHFP